MEKKYLKIIQKGMEKYNGPMSIYEFVDGESVEMIPSHERDRISASVACVEIGENGKSVVAGVAARLIADGKARAPVAEKLKVQTVEEKVAEETALAIGSDVEVSIYTEDDLDKIIDKGGIAALRQVAEIWNVKNKAIGTLRQMILDQQKEFLAKRGDQIDKKKRIVDEVERQTLAANKPIEVKGEAPDEVLDAAVTGDMGAALTEKAK